VNAAIDRFKENLTMYIKQTTLGMMLSSIIALVLTAGGVVWSTPIYGQSVTDPLTADEVAGLQYMIEEEKLARDVYLMLGEQWNLNVFQNISRAEQTHMDAVAKILARYGVDNPASDNEIGYFTDSTLQTLYDELMASGSQSVADALQVGIAIEEIDILDLKAYVADTTQPDIRQLYTNLLQGSSNHLRAFVFNLERQTGEMVQPQYLDPQTYGEIMDGGNLRGNRNRGGNRGDNRFRG
jgi:hypothetical protein